VQDGNAPSRQNEKGGFFSRPLHSKSTSRKGSPIGSIAATSAQNRCSPGYRFRSSVTTFRPVDALLKCKPTAKVAEVFHDLNILQEFENKHLTGL
jgi:hypothetical protein